MQWRTGHGSYIQGVDLVEEIDKEAGNYCVWSFSLSFLSSGCFSYSVPLLDIRTSPLQACL